MVENALAPESEVEYPRWITPHLSWIVKKGSHVALRELTEEVNVDRTGKCSALVHDAKTEARLLGPYIGLMLVEPKSASKEAQDLHAEIESIKAEKAHAAHLKSQAKLAVLLEAEAKRRGDARTEILGRHESELNAVHLKHADELAAFEAANHEISLKRVAESESPDGA